MPLNRQSTLGPQVEDEPRARPVPDPAGRGWPPGPVSCASLTTVLGALLALGLALAQRPQAADQMIPLDGRAVKVGGELGRRLEVTATNNLLVLDVERDFLPAFKAKNRNDGYIGLGKLIDAAVHLAASSGDERVRARKQLLVNRAIELQEPDGYLGIIKPEKRVFALWDIHEMSYLIYGLTSDYRFFGEKASLAAATKLADYLIGRWTAEPGREPGGGEITVHMAVTGVESAMLALYRQTQERRYLDFCEKFRKLTAWDARIVTGRWGTIEGHAYAHICRCVAQLRLYRLQPHPRLLEPARAVCDFLTGQEGLTITGECGDHECWHNTQEGTINLGESCATAYSIRFLDELLRLEGDAQYGDLMERVLYNAMFAAQSPDGRHIRYYTPFDGPRAYFQGDTYCCPNNLRRIIAELPEFVYYRMDGGVAVNLYTASTAKLELRPGLSLTLRQETDYPASGKVVLRVDPSTAATFPLRLRLPRWCQEPRVTVNDSRVTEPIERGTFCVLTRSWKPGDRVTLELPMPWRLVKGRVAQAGRVAIMRGPQVFCLNRARHKELAKFDLRLLVLDPSSLTGPTGDESVRPQGVAGSVRAWSPGGWYPSGKPDLSLTLTEFADPGGEATYLKVPNPGAPELVADELLGPGR